MVPTVGAHTSSGYGEWPISASMDAHRVVVGRMTSMKLIRNEDGFSLMESVVAMVITLIIFSGVGVSLGAAMRHQHDVRLQQQATALAIQELEVLRGFGTWEELLLMSAPPGSDPFVTGGGELDANAVGIAANEPFEVDATNGLVAYQDLAFETYDGQDFDVYRYVSLADTDLRRLIVVVEWTSSGVTRQEVASTLKAELGT